MSDDTPDATVGSNGRAALLRELREAREESGIEGLVPAQRGIYDVDVHRIPARANEPAHLHYDVRFAFYVPDDAEPRASDESHAVAWLALDELERYGVDDSVRRLAAKTARLKCPRPA
ncbi:MAG: NUDIX hydrolase [Vulcanimicrobiaceae bacterium]